MNVFDKFLNKVAYKFEKGYPDMSNEQDIQLLESLLSKVLGEEFVLISETDAEEGIEILKKELGFKDEDFVRQSSKTYKLLVPRSERIDIITKMSGIENQYHIPEVEQIDTDFITKQAANISDFLKL